MISARDRNQPSSHTAVLDIDQPTEVTKCRKYRKNDDSPNNVSKFTRWRYSQKKHAYTNFGQTKRNETQRLRDEIEVKACDDVALRFDVLNVSACAILDFRNDDHHFCKDSDLDKEVFLSFDLLTTWSASSPISRTRYLTVAAIMK